MNFIEMMGRMAEYQATHTKTACYEAVRNMISHAVAEMKDAYCARTDGSRRDVDYTLQRLISYLIVADQGVYEEEYAAYCKCCDLFVSNPLSLAQYQAFCNELNFDMLVQDVYAIVYFRDQIDPDKYEAFVWGLALLALIGDASITEAEYIILSMFFDESRDYIPSWEEYVQLG